MSRAGAFILIVFVVAGTVRAELVVNLRFPDGSLVKDIIGMNVGDTVTFEVWATITGQPGNAAPEGLHFMYFNVLSREIVLVPFDGGGINGRAMQAPFDRPPVQEGLINDANGDGVLDLGTLPAGNTIDMARALAASPVSGPTSGFGQAVQDGWEFRVQYVNYTINANDLLGGKRTAFDPWLPTSTGVPAAWSEDGAPQSLASRYHAGTSIVITRSIPEPFVPIFAVFAIARTSFLRNRRCRKSATLC